MGSANNVQAICWIFSALLLSMALFASGFQLDSRPAEEWIARLERPERLAQLKRDEVIAHLGLKSGDIVTDIGAGTGVFSRPMARAVAPGGKVLAVEVDQALLDEVDRRAQQENVQNVEAILGQFDDPNLPTRDVDLAFIHNVLHHIEHREAYLKTLASYLKPKGRVAIIDRDDLHGHGSPHRDEPEMHITLDQVKEWMAAAGFGVAEEFDLFEDKYFLIFSRNQ